MKLRIRTVSALVLLLLAVSPLHAFDATGTWEGQWTCKEFDDGLKDSDKQKPSTMRISQNGATAVVNVDNGDFVFDARVIDDANKPEKGEMLLIECASDDDPSAGFAEMMRAVVKTKAGKVTASFNGLSNFQDVGAGFVSFGTCKYKYKRVSTADPLVAGCL